MRIANATPRGSTVFVTDLHIRVGSQAVPISVDAAALSIDLRDALNKGLVHLEFDPLDEGNPFTSSLRALAAAADARREGLLLFTQIESSIKERRLVDSVNVPVRPAVFKSVG